MHRAGFVNIIGKPNAGKSTLLNALIGEKMSIISPKAQTTRHRIIGIHNEEDLQIVFSDTPGIIEPKYKLQEKMMQFVHQSLKDADLILLLIDMDDEKGMHPCPTELINTKTPILVLLNKIDLCDEVEIVAAFEHWQTVLKPKAVLPISALHSVHLEQVMGHIKEYMPEHPAYYDKDALTDKPERFFVTEIIREKILLQYSQEIPYACEVVVESFTEEEKINKIHVVIVVERDTQKSILIGKGGSALKRVGIAAREDIEAFLGKKCYLEMFVKVIKDWRKKDTYLSQFGYRVK